MSNYISSLISKTIHIFVSLLIIDLKRYSASIVKKKKVLYSTKKQLEYSRMNHGSIYLTRTFFYPQFNASEFQ